MNEESEDVLDQGGRGVSPFNSILLHLCFMACTLPACTSPILPQVLRLAIEMIRHANTQIQADAELFNALG
jgi:hypothetical protein